LYCRVTQSPRHSSPTLGIPERLLFSVGLSLAIAVLGGLLLNWTPWGLQAESWALLLGGTALSASGLALIRRRGFVVGPTIVGTGLGFPQILLLGLAALVVVVAVALARTPSSQQGLQGYTMLWILPSGDADQNTVRLGVSSMEFTTVKYRLQVEVKGQIAHSWPVIELEPGEKWEMTIDLPTEQYGSQPVEAVLYHADTPGSVYRQVTLWRDK
jgi:uncharacterized membrane protein